MRVRITFSAEVRASISPCTRASSRSTSSRSASLPWCFDSSSDSRVRSVTCARSVASVSMIWRVRSSEPMLFDTSRPSNFWSRRTRFRRGRWPAMPGGAPRSCSWALTRSSPAEFDEAPSNWHWLGPASTQAFKCTSRTAMTRSAGSSSAIEYE
jgi:hypothetical protein